MSKFAKHSNQHRGFSLIELLVASLIGVFVMAGAIKVYSSNKTTYQLQEAMSEAQKNGRFILNRLTSRIQGSGYSGFYSSYSDGVESALNTPTSEMWNIAQPVKGYDNVSATTTIAGITGFYADNDVILVKTMVDPVDLESNVASDELIVAATTNYTISDILVVADHEQASIFQIDSADTTTVAGQTAVTLSSGATTSPGNSKALDNSYSTNAVVGKLESIMYYMKSGNNGRPALYEAKLVTADGETAAMNEKEIIANVEGFQISYGVDTSGDDAINSYETAASIESNSQWPNVKSIGISLLLSSSNANITPENNSYSFDADAFTFEKDTIPASGADKRIRRVFNTYVALKNL
ncbi:MAG: Unknown protein [uncultured Thiotrichaceae bacterium]|uniref:Type IV fimbrial biogenesis protein PilW n=1 Tax=uncultured Thiotrichaceae bacterium TaxID=298394 RepID=A0A6S6S0M5_9GAMM|nr:MAG: Unknown protein [uncultured Thiotrichaceae bacterium]